MSFIPFTDAAKISNRFLNLLSDYEIDPLNRGQVEDEFLSVVELLELWENPVVRSERDEGVLCTAAGVHDFAAKVLAAKNLPEFPSFQHHLNLIAKGTLLTSISQMTGGDPDDASRKLVELYVASLVVHCGENVLLDHPVHSKGNNPDILLDYCDKHWAIAIKTVSSKHGQTLYENIKKAAQQIEKSDADRGLILLNVKNVVNHDRIWHSEFSSLGDAIGELGSEIRTLFDASEESRLGADWSNIFEGRKAVAPVLMLGQSVAKVPTAASDKTPTAIKMLVGHNFNQEVDENGQELSSCMNHMMQTILKGEPGPPPN